ncbi:MAG: Txe/YoeB family addiction module toxin [Agathobacter sp.]|uniref:Txe/YoeB family addiction module toxin n=1 Tax=Agathobacter sp. TaxID=2021311 RepID=UPI002E76A1A3|nr:Txe/YoeB family addiction module toxin [Agathobacter sp.]MEE1218110.1 Txe/YoeB family addiction module toxin [Agathobacter sp.]
MSRPQFTELAWNEYMYWHNQDKKTLKKINKLISDIMKNGALEGEGKPERLKGDLSGYYSRRINEKDRLIYRVIDDDIVEIYSCQGHYSDK